MYREREQPSFHTQKQNGADVIKPNAGATTNNGVGLSKPGEAAAAGGGSRRALGDITNARGGNAAAALQGKMVKTRSATAAAAAVASSTRTFGLASAAPPRQPPPPAAAEATVDESEISMERSRGEGEMNEEVAAMDLTGEVEAIDMHIEQTEELQALGSITDTLQIMTMTPSLSMRPVLPPDVDDIDQPDLTNPMACTDYVEDQYDFYYQKEFNPGYHPKYMEKQPYINTRMRAILVDWLVEVHYKFKCCPETLYLTINIIDRFLDRKQVPRAKLQLVGVTAFLVACKYEEIYPPEVKELVYMTDGAYTKKQIIEMEAFMLATLKFQVTVCTTHGFLVRFLKAGHADNKIYFLASYICERTLQEVEILHFLPSVVAAAAVYLARKNCGLRPWSPTLTHYTRYTEETLLSCLRKITEFLNTRSQTLQAIRKKYGSVKFMMVSGLELEGV